MKIYLDETGDPHPNAGTFFGVGALFVSDERSAEVVVQNAAQAMAAPGHQFHATSDSEAARQSLLNSLDSGSLRCDVKIVGFDTRQMVDVPPTLHQRAVGLVLSLAPFTDETTEIIISERAASFTQCNVEALRQILFDSQWDTLGQFPNLRRHPTGLPPITVVPGTAHAGLQLCDHILWRWQRSLRVPAEQLAWPIGSLLVWQRPVTELPHFQATNYHLNGGVVFDELRAYDSSRPLLPDVRHAPLWSAYGCLAHAGEPQWNDLDRELIRLLLNAEPAEIYEEPALRHVCYLILEGRTRWPQRFEMPAEQFGLYSALAAAHIAGRPLDSTAEMRIYDTMRIAIRDFREQLAECSARVAEREN